MMRGRQCGSARNGCGIKQNEVVHFNVTCDGCEANPIKGIRYKCNNCPNYDLCQQCYNKGGVHNSDHAFTTIDKPAPRCPYMQRRCGTFMNQSEVIHPATCDGCANRIKGIRYKCTTCPDYDLCESCQSKKIHSEHTFNQILRPHRIPPRCPTNAPMQSIPVTKVEEEVKTPVPQVPQTQVPVTPVPVPSPVVEKKIEETIKVVQQIETPPTPVVLVEKKEEVKQMPKIEKKEEPKAVSNPFEMKLKQLEEMGFTNKLQNIEILVKNKGEMLQAVKDLLGN